MNANIRCYSSSLWPHSSSLTISILVPRQKCTTERIYTAQHSHIHILKLIYIQKPYRLLSFFTINIVYVYLGPANLYSIIIIISFHLFIYILYSTSNTSQHTVLTLCNATVLLLLLLNSSDMHCVCKIG